MSWTWPFFTLLSAQATSSRHILWAGAQHKSVWTDRRTRAESQPIAATRLLCSLQYPVQAKSSASDLSFPIFEIAIRWLAGKDIVALPAVATCHAVLDWRTSLFLHVCQPERVDIVAS